MAVYATADLHGYLDLYKKIKYFLKPDDVVYLLGDAGDRGPQSWETIKAILDDPQFIYIKGNHDDMLVKAALNYLGEERDPELLYYDLINNGGQTTWVKMLQDKNNLEYLYKLKNCPEELIYGDEIHLCHAGFTPGRRRNVLWDRKHLYEQVHPETSDNFIVVHGHTPVYYMHGAQTLDDCYKWIRPEFYANGHKINIDMGTYNTKACCLLNLDTFEYHIFQLED